MSIPLFSSSVHISSVRFVSKSTLDPAEVRKFQLLANKWWDIQGEFAPLHALNELRVPFIRSVYKFHTILDKLYGIIFLKYTKNSNN